MKRTRTNPFGKLALLFAAFGFLTMQVAVWSLVFMQEARFYRLAIILVPSASFLFAIACMFGIMYSHANRRATETIISHIEAMRRGDLTPRSIVMGTKNLRRIERAVDSFSESPIPTPIRFDCILGTEDFRRNLNTCLSTVVSLRSALLLFAYKGSPSYQSLSELETLLRSRFPDLMIGRVKSGCAIYIPYVTSAFELKSEALDVLGEDRDLRSVIAFYPSIAKEALYDDVLSYAELANPLLILEQDGCHIDPMTAYGRATTPVLSNLDFYRLPNEKNLRVLLKACGFQRLALVTFQARHWEILKSTISKKAPVLDDCALGICFDLARGEPLFVCENLDHLPMPVASYFKALGATSIALYAFETKEGEQTLIIMLSNKVEKHFDYAAQISLVLFFHAIEHHLLMNVLP